MTKRESRKSSSRTQRTRKADDQKAFNAAFPVAVKLCAAQKDLEKIKAKKAKALDTYEEGLRQASNISESEIAMKVLERQKILNHRSKKAVEDLERKQSKYANIITPPAKNAAIQRTKSIKGLIWRYMRRFGVPENRSDFIRHIKRRSRRHLVSYKGGDPFPLPDRRLKEIMTDLAQATGTPGRKKPKQS